MRRPRIWSPSKNSAQAQPPGVGRDALSPHRERALVEIDLLGERSLAHMQDFFNPKPGKTMLRELLPFQDKTGTMRKPTVWVATLRKLRVIVRAALPGDVVLILRRANARDFYVSTDFDFGVPPWVLSDMLALSRWLVLDQMTAVEKFNMSQELLQGGGLIYQVQPGSAFDHERTQANQDLTRLSLVEGEIHFFVVKPVSELESYSKGMLARNFQQTNPVVALQHKTYVSNMFLDGGPRLIPTAQARMSPLINGRVVIHPETNARGVKFWSWCRRESVLFNDQMIDPRELAIMGQHDASYVLYQLGFPQGLETDEYLVELCVRMNYLMRKGWGHLKVRDKEQLVETAVSIPGDQRRIDASLTRSREIDTRDPSLHNPVAPELPDPKPYGRIRRKRGSLVKEQAEGVKVRELLLTDL